MYENNHNVISKLIWDTTFDSRAEALALQNSLSDWSGFQMQQEMTAVFDKLCPPEQTWKIQSMELNLGTIDFDRLELELPIKLRQQLIEKLTALIFYSHQGGGHIEILDEKKSHIQLIRYFLSNGMLPWNYQAADGSVNQMLAIQLQNSPEELIAMLKEMGLSAEQVRQRMAWQFNEPNMVKIIAGFEPNVGGQIILFSNELTKIQQKENVVQSTSTTDFKKNVWLWVLNYLFTERGTVFNRIQFMKSSIVQMAAHYNMQYDQLFEIIEVAIAKLSGSLSLQPDFIVTLQLLSKENKRLKKKYRSLDTGGNTDWQSLEILFRDQKLRSATGKNEMFNELIHALSMHDKERFFTLINSFGKTSDFWLPLINDLSDDTLKRVFVAIKGSRSVLLTTSILFLNQLIGREKPNKTRNLFWYKGLMFLLEHRHTSFNQDEFLHLLIAVLAQKKQLSKMAILEQLIATDVPHSLKTLLHVEIYRSLTAIFITEVSSMPVLKFKKHLQQLMQMFNRYSSNSIKNQKLLKSLQSTLENYVKMHPKSVMEVLMAIPNQNNLKKIFPPSFTTFDPITGSSLSFVIPWTDFKIISDATKNLQETKNLLLEGMIHYPDQFLEFVKKEIVATPQLIWLNKIVSFPELIKMIGNQYKPHQSMLEMIGQFYQELGMISLNGVSASEIQYILFTKVIRAWTSGNWKLISTENIWNELIWEICTKGTVSKTAFLNSMEHGKQMFPLSLQLSLKLLIEQEHSLAKPNVDKPSIIPFLKKSNQVMQEQQDLLKGGITVKNAGFVLISSYFSVLLTRLDLLSEQKKFANAESKLKAVHYLQYLVTGLENTEEHLLPLNKVLCGVSLSQPIMESISITDEHKKLIDGLIEAIIGYWPAIGNCSVYGFRGNWLVRDGLLTEKEDRWELTVEKRAYDLLIHKSPFSFSVIKYPWMDKPLYINWPY